MPNPLGEGRTYNITVPRGVEMGDVCRYANGTEYIVTDHGPNIWGTCALCGAQAACIPTMAASKVRCGQCLLREYDLLPGNWVYEAKARYAAEHAPRRWSRGH